MARIPLTIQGVTDISASEDASLLIITDKEEKNQISIVVDSNMRYNFAVRRGKYTGSKEKRQQNIDLLSTTLPETLSAIIKYMTQIDLAVVIVGVYDGQYRAIIEDQNTNTAFPIRVSDGALLSYADPHVPLYIEESLWAHQHTPYHANAKGIAMPLNTLSVNMLQEAMKKCIEDERYEMAEQLKKELERRGV